MDVTLYEIKCVIIYYLIHVYNIFTLQSYQISFKIHSQHIWTHLQNTISITYPPFFTTYNVFTIYYVYNTP